MQENFGSALKVCVAGYGSIGRRHANNARALGAQVFAYRTGEFDSKAPGRDENIECVYDFDQVIAEKPVALLICNPTSFHMALALKAAEAGMHLFIEKPISHTLDQVQELQTLVAEKKLVCSVGYMMRFYPLILKLRDLIREGMFGKILSAHIEWGTFLPDWHPWEDYRTSYASRRELGGGVVLTCSHEVDMAVFLFGNIVEVFSYGGQRTPLEHEVDDCVDVLMKHASDTVTTLHLDFIQKPGKRTIRVIGENACADWDFHQGSLEITFSNGNKDRTELGSHFDFNQVYLENLKDFFKSITKHDRSNPIFAGGVKTLQACLGILESLEKKQAVQII